MRSKYLADCAETRVFLSDAQGCRAANDFELILGPDVTGPNYRTPCAANLATERANKAFYLCAAAIRSGTPTILMVRLRL
jgi:hypothetical protein